MAALVAASVGGSPRDKSLPSPLPLLRPRPWRSQLPALWRALAGALLLGTVQGQTTIQSIQHAPTNNSPPEELYFRPLNRDGIQENSASRRMSQFQHIGCFDAPYTITRDSEQDRNFDPATCIDVCKKKLPKVPVNQLLVAVHGLRCGCSGDWSLFTAAPSEDFCTYPCRDYENPICGGHPSYWGVFRQYEHQSLSAQGAYDPWRKIWYQIVSIPELFFSEKLDPDAAQSPERYYLHATDSTSGLPMFQYQKQVPGLLHGIQYDLDSTRIVGVLTLAETGRSVDQEWEYFLFTIDINGTNPNYPILSWLPEWKAVWKMKVDLPIQKNYFAYTGTTAIVSTRGKDTFVFTQAFPAAMLKDYINQIYFVRIPTGDIIHQATLDFNCFQLFSNEKYGDVTAVGNRMGENIYVYVARVHYSVVEDETKVDFQYNDFLPNFLVDRDRFGGLHISPGQSASDHLYNKSYIWYRNYTDDYNQPRDPELTPPMLMEVHIREATYENWCNQEDCKGTVDYRIPYSAVFNREPRIPLSLAAPALIYARFTTEGSPLEVGFDRATLRGALPVDTNGDILPDVIDYMPQLVGEWDCAEVFDEDSAKLIGNFDDGIKCKWISDSEIQITLLKGKSELQVGDQIFLRPGVIYTIPRPSENEYSTDATGGIQVGLPDPLLLPVISITGSTDLDFCSPLVLSALNSYNTGGQPLYQWSLQSYADVTARPERVFNLTKLDLLRFELKNNTEFNNPDLIMPAEYLEAGTKFEILLKITSRWGITSNETIVLTKMDFPAPMVSILGPRERIVNRSAKVSILAEGTPSNCESESKKLGYRWIETSGKLDFSQYPQILVTTRSLVIPPLVLEVAPVGEDYNVYNFTVECYAEGRPNLRTEASVGLLVQRSIVYVVLTREDRMHTRGKILILDARESQDADDPTPEKSTFKGSFEWFCLDPQREPCFKTEENIRRLPSVSPQRQLPSHLPSFGGYLAKGMDAAVAPRRLSNAPDGLIPTDAIPTCKTDVNQKIVDGGRSFSGPLFLDDDPPYCKWARGVLMTRTGNFSLGPYYWTVRITSPDGRQGSKTITITMSEFDVPSLTLSVQPEQVKHPITKVIRVLGQLESEIDPNANMEFKWEIWKYGRNPEFDLDKAREAANDPDNPYRIQEYAFLDVTPTFDFTNSSEFFINPSTPTLVIKNNVLQPSSIYKIRCIVEVGTTGAPVSGFAEATVETAGLAPSLGTLIVEPPNGTMDYPRIISAPDWVATDTPLSYKFGYLRFLGSNAARVAFNTEVLPTQRLSMDDGLPIGEASANYSLTVFVDVSTELGATTTKMVQVGSFPPENVTELLEKQFEMLEDADPEEVTGILNTILQVNNAPVPAPGEPAIEPSPEDVELMTKVLDIMDASTEDVPLTENVAVAQAVVVATVIDAGLKGNRALNSLQSLIEKAADAGLFSIQDTTLMAACFHALGSILPDDGDRLDAGGAAGQSIVAPTTGGGASQTTDGELSYEEKKLFEHVMSTLSGRQERNHDVPFKEERVINSCPTAYCDVTFLLCVQSSKGVPDLFMMCCNAPNPKTHCDEPPCWFMGNKCPRSQASLHSFERRLLPKEISPPRRMGADGHGDSRANGNFIDVWDDTGGIHPFSDYQKDDLLHSWPRQLNARTLNVSVPRDDRIAMMEREEEPVLKSVQSILKQRKIDEEKKIMADMRQELDFQAMKPGMMLKLKADKRKKEEDDALNKLEADRMKSQIITRAAVLRDVICKSGITQMASEPAMKFVTPGFIVWFGKTRNMSDVNPSFVFPDKYAVPPTAPDEPTADSPITAFSFIYVEYMKNIYGWSPSQPPGNETKLITLIVMRASTMDYDVENESEPIRVFANKALFSTALCMFWDRFQVGTAGGAWAPRGLMNDGDGGCLTTHLSDIGLFIDGRPAIRTDIGDAVSYFLETKIDVGMNYASVGILGFLLFVGAICALWGYIRDELVREAQRLEKKGNHFHLPGDGVTSKRNVDDPIAYEHANTRNVFLALTFLRVLRRDHCMIGPLTYHQKYTRPQRVLVFSVMATGVFAVNAAVYGLPDDGLMTSGQFVSSGIVSGLLAFPLYVFCAFMFAARPFLAQKRIIKRRAPTDQTESIAAKRQEIEAKSSLLPEAVTGLSDYRPPPLPPGTQPFRGSGFLALPPPAPGMPGLMPPVPSGPPGAGTSFGSAALPVVLPGLPPLPAAGGMSNMMGTTQSMGMTQNSSSPLGAPGMPGMMPGMPGLPSLPPLPKLHALPGTGMRPPPPPKTPFTGGSQTPQQFAFDSRPPPPPPKTPSLQGSALGPPGPPPGPPVIQDTEAAPSLPGITQPDAAHGAPPPAPAPHAAAGAPPPEATPKAGGEQRDTEASERAPRQVQAEALHSMMGAPALPKMMGPPPKPPGAAPVPPVGIPSFPGGESGTPRTPASRQSLLPGRLDGTPRTPSYAPPSTDRGLAPMTPPGPPPMAPQVKGIQRGIVHRGEPFEGMPPPFKIPGAPPPSMPRPPAFAPPGKRPTGVPLPPFTGPKPMGPPAVSGGTTLFGPGGAPTPPPPPPPPPNADETTFVRRTRLQYMDRAQKLHQELLLAEEDNVNWETPDYAYTITLLIPYIACVTSIVISLAVNTMYTLKFSPKEETYYTYASLVGLGLIAIPLEVVKSAITTIVELRKFEIRRAQAGGDFLRSRIRALAGEKQTPLLTPKKVPPKRPAMPEVSPKVPTRKLPPPRPPPMAANLPVVGPAPNPPMVALGAKQPGVPGLQPLPGPRGPSPVPSARSNTSGLGTREGGSLLPGRLDGTNSSLPPLAVRPPAPPLPSMGGVPGSPAGSVTSVTASLTEKLKASRVAAAAPPPPGSAPGSRPPSQRSGAAPKPPTPPPKGTLNQTRNQARQRPPQKQP